MTANVVAVTAGERPLADIREASAAFDAAGVPSPRHDAEVLAAHVLGTTRAGLLGVTAWPAGAAEAFRQLVARRVAREPLQHLTGVAYFRHLELAVGPGVFVPRPETELLVDLVLGALIPGATVVDLCAGSGAIGLAVATERPGTDVHLVEADPVAARWLRLNAEALAPDVRIHEATVLDALPLVGGSVDVVVSNPPYLPTGSAIDPEVEHDPALALWGGPDGLGLLREVIEVAVAALMPGGLLAVEHDLTHQDAVLDLLRHSGFREVTGHLDLTGRPRFATARAPAKLDR